MTEASELDEYFGPRRKVKAVEKPAEDGPRPWAANLYEFGVTTAKAKKKRDPSKPTAKQLEQIGEALTRAIFKKAGIQLKKIPTGRNWYGYAQSTDVDFVSVNRTPQMKVEAKAWWAAQNPRFAIARINDNERIYIKQAFNSGCDVFVTIALLDGEPTRAACNTVYVIPWPVWIDIELALKARASGNFKGRSLRVRDLDLLEPHAIRRNGRQWDVGRMPK